MRRPTVFAFALCAPLAFAVAAGCSPRNTPAPERTLAAQPEATHAAPAAAPVAAPAADTAAPAAATVPAPTAPVAAPAADTAARAPASAPDDAPSPAPAPAASPAAPTDSAPLPNVKVANIGMHIGGGPHDDVTKEPIRRSVAPHFDELRRCFALAEDPAKGGDFGVDLRIERDGGKAQVREPRTAIKGKAFKRCVVGVFEQIDFLKPRRGATVVSYSLRFTPL